VAPHPDPVEYRTRFVVLGYEATGAAATDQILIPDHSSVKTLAVGRKFKIFQPGENRQQVQSFTMSEPTTITYRWFAQNGVRVATTSPSAEEHPQVTKVNDPTSFATELNASWFAQPSSVLGSSLSWWFKGTNLRIEAARPGVTSNKTPTGVLLSTGDLGTRTATGGGSSLGFGQFTLQKGASVTFQYGERIYRGVVDLGSPIDFSNPRAAGSKVLSGKGLALDRKDVGSVDLQNSSYTIDFWARSTSPTGGHILVHEDGQAKYLRIGFEDNRRFFVKMSNGSGEVVASPSIEDDGSFHHWAIVWNRESTPTRFEIFRDGASVFAETSVAWSYTADFGVPFILGISPALSAPFEGEIDNLRIWKSAKPASALYSAPTDRIALALASPFDRLHVLCF
jgi:hypothetical protein